MSEDVRYTEIYEAEVRQWVRIIDALNSMYIVGDFMYPMSLTLSVEGCEEETYILTPEHSDTDNPKWTIKRREY